MLNRPTTTSTLGKYVKCAIWTHTEPGTYKLTHNKKKVKVVAVRTAARKRKNDNSRNGEVST